MVSVENKKRILVTTSTLPRYEGDPEPRFVLDLCKALSKYFDVTILAPADPEADLVGSLEGVKIRRYRYAPFRFMEKLAYPGAILPRIKQNPFLSLLIPMMFVGLWWAVRKELKRQTKSGEKYSCVHSHWLVPQGMVQAIFSKRNGYPPFIVTSHGGDISSLGSPMMLKIYKYVLKKASGLTIVSESIKGVFEAKLYDEVFKLNPAVISMGVDVDQFNAGKRQEDWASRHDLAHPMILFAGRLAEKKGLAYLLDAMAMPPLCDSSATLAIIGSGPLESDLKKQVDRLKLQEKVKFISAIPHSELSVAFASADLMCSPSIVASNGDTEGLPTVLCEAAASGIPVVATKVSGVPEVVVDGKTGILVDQKQSKALSEACFQLVSNKALRQEQGEAAIKHIERFGWESIGEKYAAAIERAIAVQR